MRLWQKYLLVALAVDMLLLGCAKQQPEVKTTSKTIAFYDEIPTLVLPLDYEEWRCCNMVQWGEDLICWEEFDDMRRTELRIFDLKTATLLQSLNLESPVDFVRAVDDNIFEVATVGQMLRFTRDSNGEIELVGSPPENYSGYDLRTDFGRMVYTSSEGVFLCDTKGDNKKLLVSHDDAVKHLEKAGLWKTREDTPPEALPYYGDPRLIHGGTMVVVTLISPMGQDPEVGLLFIDLTTGKAVSMLDLFVMGGTVYYPDDDTILVRSGWRLSRITLPDLTRVDYPMGYLDDRGEEEATLSFSGDTVIYNQSDFFEPWDQKAKLYSVFAAPLGAYNTKTPLFQKQSSMWITAATDRYIICVLTNKDERSYGIIPYYHCA